MGFKVSKEFVSNSIDWFEDAYFLFTVKKYDKSFSKQNLNPKKVYCIDHALVNSVSPGIAEKKGYLLENMVFVHLRRKTNEIYYYKTRQGNEVDFYWLDEKHTPHLVQVTWDIEDENTKKREIRALVQAMEENGIIKATLVSRNHSDTIEKGGRTIDVVPAWRYLLL